ncbi:MAG: zf-TFIIB domain-containing protein, partial [Oligoflexia bacterium]|nr:zf-TFIIB domain-containing protein [Oligoflexia bacterium]
MTCPKCKGQFKELKLKGTQTIVDICQLCYAVWFDKEEFWTVLQNTEVKTRFKIQGLLNKKITQYKCPKCHNSQTFLEQGLLPMTQVEVEHCSLCDSFLFDDREYRKAKEQSDKNSNRIESAFEEESLETVSTKKDPLVLLVSSIGLLAMAFMLFNSGNFRSASQTKHWLKTTGKISQSYVEGKNTRSIHDYYLVKVSYDYQVGNMTYKGKNILKNDDILSFSDKAGAERAISAFP